MWIAFNEGGGVLFLWITVWKEWIEDYVKIIVEGKFDQDFFFYKLVKTQFYSL